jgi:hypothetical protein
MEHTERGFAIYARLTDTNGYEVRVQESSSAEERKVWIFCGPIAAGPTPHLNEDQARQVRDALTAFLSPNEPDSIAPLADVRDDQS